MKEISAVVILLFIITGTYLVYQRVNAKAQTAEINRYIETKGGAPVPSTWRNKIGKGI